MKAGVQAILQKIHQDAHRFSGERHARIRTEFDADIERETARYEEEFNKQREMLLRNNEYEYGQRLERMRSRMNRELLTYQHGLIDEIFEMAVQKLRNASREEFSGMYQAAVQGLEGCFTLRVGAFSTGKLDRRLVEETRAGLTVVFSDQPITGKSGFLLVNDRVEYNWLFEDLIEDKKREQAALIFKEVFGE